MSFHPAALVSPPAARERGPDGGPGSQPAHEGPLRRRVPPSRLRDWRVLRESGLLRALVEGGRLLAHEPEPAPRPAGDGSEPILRVEEVPFPSCPHEWCFGELQEAAILTLEAQALALRRGMVLAEAPAWNVQFRGPTPVLTDALTFEVWREGTPWRAHGQFCRHFLAPLALIAHVDPALRILHALQPDGVPLPLAARLLPLRTRLRPGLLRHLHIPAARLRRGSVPVPPPEGGRASLADLARQARGLLRAVEGLAWSPGGLEWADGTESGAYAPAALEAKERIVSTWLRRLRPRTVWDLAAGTGRFSRLGSGTGACTVAFDPDPALVERTFLRARKDGDAKLLPLCLDLAAAGPGLPWAPPRHPSLGERGPADVVLALAFLHRFAHARGLPLGETAAFLRRLGRRLVVEFVPPEDPQARRLLATRRGASPPPSAAVFEAAFARHFRFVAAGRLEPGGRVLHLLEARAGSGDDPR